MRKIILFVFSLFICEKVFAAPGFSYPWGGFASSTWQNVLNATPKDWIMMSLLILALSGLTFLVYILISRIRL